MVQFTQDPFRQPAKAWRLFLRQRDVDWFAVFEIGFGVQDLLRAQRRIGEDTAKSGFALFGDDCLLKPAAFPIGKQQRDPHEQSR